MRTVLESYPVLEIRSEWDLGTEEMGTKTLIGNTDRHHENWGILIELQRNHWRVNVAPSFDHASSLGRELRVERQHWLLAADRVGDYVE
jgi:hypothetical protein